VYPACGILVTSWGVNEVCFVLQTNQLEGKMGLKGEPADSLGDIGGSASVFNPPVHAIEFKHTLLSDKISDNPMMMLTDGVLSQ